jgi:hypothetical protein
MTLQEAARDSAHDHKTKKYKRRSKAEVAARRAKREAEREAERARLTQFQNPNMTYTYKQWCVLNGFGETTGRRIINGPNPPIVTQLSKRRIGITVENNRAWQESRAREA